MSQAWALILITASGIVLSAVVNLVIMSVALGRYKRMAEEFETVLPLIYKIKSAVEISTGIAINGNVSYRKKET